MGERDYSDNQAPCLSVPGQSSAGETPIAKAWLYRIEATITACRRKDARRWSPLWTFGAGLGSTSASSSMPSGSRPLCPTLRTSDSSGALTPQHRETSIERVASPLRSATRQDQVRPALHETPKDHLRLEQRERGADARLRTPAKRQGASPGGAAGQVDRNGHGDAARDWPRR